MRFNFFSILALVAVVAADEYTLAALNHIQQANTEFNNALAGWNGQYLTALPLLQQWRDLSKTLNAASSPQASIKTIRAVCAEDVEQQSFDVARSLAVEVGKTVDTAISMKPKLEAIPAVGKRMGLVIFNNLRSSASGLSTAFSSKARKENQADATAIVKMIDDHFARGIAAYST